MHPLKESRLSFMILALLYVSTGLAVAGEGASASGGSWRVLPLITEGKLSPAMIEKLKEASEKHLGGWYPVHHGYEVQILDDTDALHRTGAIYSLAKAAPVPGKPLSDWRTMIITLDGERAAIFAVAFTRQSRYAAAFVCFA